MKYLRNLRWDSLVLPFIGIFAIVLLWAVIAGRSTTTQTVDDFGDPVTVTKRAGISPDLPGTTTVRSSARATSTTAPR